MSEDTPQPPEMTQTAQVNPNAPIEAYKVPRDLAQRILNILGDLPARNSMQLILELQQCQPMYALSNMTPLNPDED